MCWRNSACDFNCCFCAFLLNDTTNSFLLARIFIPTYNTLKSLSDNSKMSQLIKLFVLYRQITNIRAFTQVDGVHLQIVWTHSCCSVWDPEAPIQGPAAPFVTSVHAQTSVCVCMCACVRVCVCVRAHVFAERWESFNAVRSGQPPVFSLLPSSG